MSKHNPMHITSIPQNDPLKTIVAPESVVSAVPIYMPMRVMFHYKLWDFYKNLFERFIMINKEKSLLSDFVCKRIYKEYVLCGSIDISKILKIYTTLRERIVVNGFGTSLAILEIATDDVFDIVSFHKMLSAFLTFIVTKTKLLVALCDKAQYEIVDKYIHELVDQQKFIKESLDIFSKKYKERAQNVSGLLYYIPDFFAGSTPDNIKKFFCLLEK